MSLGGWQRLWIVVCVAYLVVVGVVAVLTLPEWRNLEESRIRQRLTAESLAILEGRQPKVGDDVTPVIEGNTGVASPIVVDFAGRTVEFPAGTADSVVELVAQDYAAASNDVLGLERREHYLAALAWWAGPCIAILIIGRSIKWVRDGFSSRPRAVEPPNAADAPRDARRRAADLAPLDRQRRTRLLFGWQRGTSGRAY